MRKIVFILFVVSSFIFFSGKKDSFESEPAVVNEKYDGHLKTFNGCWDMYHLIVNRGDSESNMPATIGFWDSQTGNLTIIDTVPGNNLLDVCFEDAAYQTYYSALDPRYFAVVSKKFIYSYSFTPDSLFGNPKVSRIDSILTPPLFSTCMLRTSYNSSRLLVVNGLPDSVSFQYSFYRIPSFSLEKQTIIKLRPEKIMTDRYYSSYYLIAGDSAGIGKCVKIDTVNYNVFYDVNLPPAAANVSEVIEESNLIYFLSSPGDSAVNIIRLNEADTSFNVSPLFSGSGINVSALGYYAPTFYFQVRKDTSSANLDTKIFVADAKQGKITDTLGLNKKIISLHYNNSSGWGPTYYRLIMGTKEGFPGNMVYYYPYLPGKTDSLRAGWEPSWFLEDMRCQVGVDEIERNLAIYVYPVPADEEVKIMIKGLVTGKTYPFDIIDVNGKVIWHQDIAAKLEYSIPLHTFPKGVLFLRVNTGKKIVTKKIIRQ